MRKLSQNEEGRVPRTIKLSADTWSRLSDLKDRDKSWEIVIIELLSHIEYFKKIGKK